MISKDFRVSLVVQVMNGIIGTASQQARRNSRKGLAGLTLTELVCVIGIMAIVASFYLGAVIRAFTKVVKFLKGF